MDALSSPLLYPSEPVIPFFEASVVAQTSKHDVSAALHRLVRAKRRAQYPARSSEWYLKIHCPDQSKSERESEQFMTWVGPDPCSGVECAVPTSAARHEGCDMTRTTVPVH